jgi:hypothetical protein
MTTTGAVNESVKKPVWKRIKYRAIMGILFSLLISPFLFISIIGLPCLDDDSGYSDHCHASYIEPMRGFAIMFQFALAVAYFVAFVVLAWRAIVKPKDISLRTFSIVIGVGLGMIAFLLTAL